MIILKNNPSENWQEIENFLKEKGVDFVKLDDEDNTARDLYGLSGEIIAKACEIANRDFSERELTIIGIMAKEIGWGKDEFEIKFQKNAPDDYDGGYIIAATMEQELQDLMESEDVSWAEDLLEDIKYEFDAEMLEIEESDTLTIEIPTKRGTYNILEI